MQSVFGCLCFPIFIPNTANARMWVYTIPGMLFFFLCVCALCLPLHLLAWPHLCGACFQTLPQDPVISALVCIMHETNVCVRTYLFVLSWDSGRLVMVSEHANPTFSEKSVQSDYPRGCNEATKCGWRKWGLRRRSGKFLMVLCCEVK